MTERHKGYVVGCNRKPDNKNIWKVRVKDENSSFNGQKFTVVSVCGEMELARGLNVNFAVGTIDGEKGQKVFRAVDVRLETLPINRNSQNVRKGERI